MAKPWLQIISGLRKLLAEFGPIWPSPSTKLAGYAEDGPYHCEDCEYLRGKKEGKIFADANGKGRCSQAVMMADPEVPKDKDFFPIVNIQKGCCEFVEPPKRS